MKKRLIKLGLGLLAVVVVLLGVGFFLPKAWSVSRTVEVKADRARLVELLATPKRWQDWSAWNKTKYPEMQVDYTGPDQGVGASWAWKGPDSGNGSLEINRANLEGGVGYVLRFEDFPPTEGSFDFSPAGEAVQITWTMQGEVHDDPVSRWFALAMGPMMSGEMEQGLSGLKAIAER